jgi:hypothetical protein
MMAAMAAEVDSAAVQAAAVRVEGEEASTEAVEFWAQLQAAQPQAEVGHAAPSAGPAGSVEVPLLPCGCFMISLQASCRSGTLVSR